jgi:hypothetical protein
VLSRGWRSLRHDDRPFMAALPHQLRQDVLRKLRLLML